MTDEEVVTLVKPCNLKPGNRILLDGNIVRIDRGGWYWDDIKKWQFSYVDSWGSQWFFLKSDQEIEVFKSFTSETEIVE